MEITPRDRKYELNDDIILALHEKFLSAERQNIKSWHFFRETNLRFRMELQSKEIRDGIAERLDDFLDSLKTVQEHYFARHGQRVTNLDKGFSGERETYKRLWPYQKKLWEWGSEMAIEITKEFRETDSNDPPREFQLERVYHLLYNQLNPLFLNEVEIYQRCANNRMLVWSQMQSLSLDSRLFETIKKELSKKES